MIVHHHLSINYDHPHISWDVKRSRRHLMQIRQLSDICLHRFSSIDEQTYSVHAERREHHHPTHVSSSLSVVLLKLSLVVQAHFYA
jgi:hypothetical protein